MDVSALVQQMHDTLSQIHTTISGLSTREHDARLDELEKKRDSILAALKANYDMEREQAERKRRVELEEIKEARRREDEEREARRRREDEELRARFSSEDTDMQGKLDSELQHVDDETEEQMDRVEEEAQKLIEGSRERLQSLEEKRREINRLIDEQLKMPLPAIQTRTRRVRGQKPATPNSIPNDLPTSMPAPPSERALGNHDKASEVADAPKATTASVVVPDEKKQDAPELPAAPAPEDTARTGDVVDVPKVVSREVSREAIPQPQPEPELVLSTREIPAAEAATTPAQSQGSSPERASGVFKKFGSVFSWGSPKPGKSSEDVVQEESKEEAQVLAVQPERAEQAPRSMEIEATKDEASVPAVSPVQHADSVQAEMPLSEPVQISEEHQIPVAETVVATEKALEEIPREIRSDDLHEPHHDDEPEHLPTQIQQEHPTPVAEIVVATEKPSEETTREPTNDHTHESHHNDEPKHLPHKELDAPSDNGKESSEQQHLDIIEDDHAHMSSQAGDSAIGLDLDHMQGVESHEKHSRAGSPIGSTFHDSTHEEEMHDHSYHHDHHDEEFRDDREIHGSAQGSAVSHVAEMPENGLENRGVVDGHVYEQHEHPSSVPQEHDVPATEGHAVESVPQTPVLEATSTQDDLSHSVGNSEHELTRHAGDIPNYSHPISPPADADIPTSHESVHSPSDDSVQRGESVDQASIEAGHEEAVVPQEKPNEIEQRSDISEDEAAPASIEAGHGEVTAVPQEKSRDVVTEHPEVGEDETVHVAHHAESHDAMQTVTHGLDETESHLDSLNCAEPADSTQHQLHPEHDNSSPHNDEKHHEEEEEEEEEDDDDVHHVAESHELPRDVQHEAVPDDSHATPVHEVSDLPADVQEYAREIPNSPVESHPVTAVHHDTRDEELHSSNAQNIEPESTHEVITSEPASVNSQPITPSHETDLKDEKHDATPNPEHIHGSEHMDNASDDSAHPATESPENDRSTTPEHISADIPIPASRESPALASRRQSAWWESSPAAAVITQPLESHAANEHELPKGHELPRTPIIEEQPSSHTDVVSEPAYVADDVAHVETVDIEHDGHLPGHRDDVLSNDHTDSDAVNAHIEHGSGGALRSPSETDESNVLHASHAVDHDDESVPSTPAEHDQKDSVVEHASHDDEVLQVAHQAGKQVEQNDDDVTMSKSSNETSHPTSPLPETDHKTDELQAERPSSPEDASVAIQEHEPVVERQVASEISGHASDNEKDVPEHSANKPLAQDGIDSHNHHSSKSVDTDASISAHHGEVIPAHDHAERVNSVVESSAAESHTEQLGDNTLDHEITKHAENDLHMSHDEHVSEPSHDDQRDLDSQVPQSPVDQARELEHHNMSLAEELDNACVSEDELHHPSHDSHEDHATELQTHGQVDLAQELHDASVHEDELHHSNHETHVDQTPEADNQRGLDLAGELRNASVSEDELHHSSHETHGDGHVHEPESHDIVHLADELQNASVSEDELHREAAVDHSIPSHHDGTYVQESLVHDSTSVDEEKLRPEHSPVSHEPSAHEEHLNSSEQESLEASAAKDESVSHHQDAAHPIQELSDKEVNNADADISSPKNSPISHGPSAHEEPPKSPEQEPLGPTSADHDESVSHHHQDAAHPGDDVNSHKDDIPTDHSPATEQLTSHHAVVASEQSVQDLSKQMSGEDREQGHAHDDDDVGSPAADDISVAEHPARSNSEPDNEVERELASDGGVQAPHGPPAVGTDAHAAVEGHATEHDSEAVGHSAVPDLAVDPISHNDTVDNDTQPEVHPEAEKTDSFLAVQAPPPRQASRSPLPVENDTVHGHEDLFDDDGASYVDEHEYHAEQVSHGGLDDHPEEHVVESQLKGHEDQHHHGEDTSIAQNLDPQKDKGHSDVERVPEHLEEVHDAPRQTVHTEMEKPVTQQPVQENHDDHTATPITKDTDTTENTAGHSATTHPAEDQELDSLTNPHLHFLPATTYQPPEPLYATAGLNTQENPFQHSLYHEDERRGSPHSDIDWNVKEQVVEHHLDKRDDGPPTAVLTAEEFFGAQGQSNVWQDEDENLHGQQRDAWHDAPLQQPETMMHQHAEQGVEQQVDEDINHMAYVYPDPETEEGAKTPSLRPSSGKEHSDVDPFELKQETPSTPARGGLRDSIHAPPRTPPPQSETEPAPDFDAEAFVPRDVTNVPWHARDRGDTTYSMSTIASTISTAPSSPYHSALPIDKHEPVIRDSWPTPLNNAMRSRGNSQLTTNSNDEFDPFRYDTGKIYSPSYAPNNLTLQHSSQEPPMQQPQPPRQEVRETTLEIKQPQPQSARSSLALTGGGAGSPMFQKLRSMFETQTSKSSSTSSAAEPKSRPTTMFMPVGRDRSASSALRKSISVYHDNDDEEPRRGGFLNEREEDIDEHSALLGNIN